jgi:hypothetical protein
VWKYCGIADALQASQALQALQTWQAVLTHGTDLWSAAGAGVAE